MKAESQIEKSLTAKSKTPPPNQKLKVKVIFSLVNSFLSMIFRYLIIYSPVISNSESIVLFTIYNASPCNFIGSNK